MKTPDPPEAEVRHDQLEPLPLQPVPQCEIAGPSTPFNLVAMIGAGGALLMLVAAMTPAVQGATRSSQLRWQEQQAALDRAERESCIGRVGHIDRKSCKPQ